MKKQMILLLQAPDKTSWKTMQLMQQKFKIVISHLSTIRRRDIIFVRTTSAWQRWVFLLLISRAEMMYQEKEKITEKNGAKIIGRIITIRRLINMIQHG